MMSFYEYTHACSSQEDQLLNESVLRTAAIASFAAASRTHATKIENSINNALRSLSVKSTNDTESLENIKEALKEICLAIKHQRHQTGSHVSLNLTASLLMSRALREFLDNEKRKRRR